MQKIEFNRTWCDYTTKCPYYEKEENGHIIMVGSYECSKCKYHIGSFEGPMEYGYHGCYITCSKAMK